MPCLNKANTEIKLAEKTPYDGKNNVPRCSRSTQHKPGESFSSTSGGDQRPSRASTYIAATFACAAPPSWKLGGETLFNCRGAPGMQGSDWDIASQNSRLL